MINTFIHSRSSLKNYTRFQTKMGKVYTSFQTKTKTLPDGAEHTYIAHKGVSPPRLQGTEYIFTDNIIKNYRSWVTFRETARTVS